MNESIDIHLEFPCIDGGSVSGPVEVTPLGPNLYRLEETPFAGFVEEAGYGDVIEVTPNADDMLVFQRIVQKSNYKRFDFVLPKVVAEGAELKQLLQRVSVEGGHWEVVFGGVVLVSLPRDSTLDVSSEIHGLRDAFVA